ncbi:kinesin, putative [Trypanosoma cruzi]|nr:kinesin, putative [Trypanosoma cruzi]
MRVFSTAVVGPLLCQHAYGGVAPSHRCAAKKILIYFQMRRVLFCVRVMWGLGLTEARAMTPLHHCEAAVEAVH